MEVNIISEVVFIDYPNYLDGMGYLLLWLETLAVALMFVYACRTFAAGLKKQLWRRVSVAIAAIIPLSGGLFFSLIGWILLSGDTQPGWFFAYALLWTVAYAGGCFVLLKRSGIFQSSGEAEPSWSSARAAGVFAIVFAIWVGTLGMMDASVKATLASHQAKASLRGLSYLPAPVAEEKNARFVYEKAYKDLGDWNRSPAWFSDVEKASFDPNSEEVKAFLSKHSETLALTRSAAAMNEYYFHTDLDFLSPIPEAGGYRFLARLLALDAKVRAAQGDYTSAYNDISTIHAMAMHVSRPPLLLSTFIGNALHHVAISTLESLLAVSESVPRGLEGGRAPMRAESLYDSFRRSIAVEGAMIQSSLTHDLVTDSRVDGGEALFGPLISLYRTYFASYDVAFQDAFWRRQRALYEQPVYEAISRLDEFEKETMRGSILSTIATSSFFRYVERIAEGQAGLLAADAGLAATRFRKDHGHYPQGFDDLVPEYLAQVPMDPFDGNPMRMKSVDSGLIIYSVGNNLKDDGGMLYDEYKKTGDVAFYLGEAYREQRLKPALAEALKRKTKSSRRK